MTRRFRPPGRSNRATRPLGARLALVVLPLEHSAGRRAQVVGRQREARPTRNPAADHSPHARGSSLPTLRQVFRLPVVAVEPRGPLPTRRSPLPRVRRPARAQHGCGSDVSNCCNSLPILDGTRQATLWRVVGIPKRQPQHKQQQQEQRQLHWKRWAMQNCTRSSHTW